VKCVLFQKLRALPSLRRPVPTQDSHILATCVHAEVSWYGESQRLEIRPDITILDPEHLSILHRYEPLKRQRSILDPFTGLGMLPADLSVSRRPPSKQFEFAGKAITFELKFARYGINSSKLTEIENDYRKFKRLFHILDRRGEGDTIFSYLVVFDKYQQSLDTSPFAEFLRSHGSSHKHKIIYRARNLRRKHL
jgi:hypothetical protein